MQLTITPYLYVDFSRASLPWVDIRSVLLRKSSFVLTVAFPVAVQATASISALQRIEKRFMMSMRIWISVVWRSGSRDMIYSAKSFRRLIWASTRLGNGSRPTSSRAPCRGAASPAGSRCAPMLRCGLRSRCGRYDGWVGRHRRRARKRQCVIAARRMRQPR